MGFLRQLPWGVQWEIARYVNTGFGYDRFTIADLSQWKGKDNSAAPDVTKFVTKELSIDDDDMSPEHAAAYAHEQSTKVCIPPPGMPVC